MTTKLSRRDMLSYGGAFTSSLFAGRFRSLLMLEQSQFKIAVINDEISPDFDHACFVASRDFGMSWMELRSMWGKNVTDLSDAELAETTRILRKYNIRVTDIASPLFKTDWPGAPKSKFATPGELHLAPAATFKQQDELFERCIALARRFDTSKIRCFDFWRLDDVAPYRAEIDQKLRLAAETAGKSGLLLVLENEPACNTATGSEAARTLNAVQAPALGLNWDAANSVMSGQDFVQGWKVLPKNRIHHCHCKNTEKNAASTFSKTGEMRWAPIDQGAIDWAAQFRLLKQSGYRDAVSLETHWNGGGTPEQSTRVGWAGMKKALEEAAVLRPGQV